PALKTWVEEQNAHTRGILDRLPGRPAIRDRLEQPTHSISPHYFAPVHRHRTLFALKDHPPQNQPVLVELPSPRDPSRERVLLDPNAMDSTGSLTIDFYVPSLDGSKVAVSLSRGGTESGDVHVLDARNGRDLGEVIPHVNGGTAGGSVAWAPDGSGL